MTLRICSSLDLERSLLRCYEYLDKIVPLNFLNLVIWDDNFKYPDVVASVEEGEIDRSPPENYFHFAVPDDLRLFLKNLWEKPGCVRMINSWDESEYSKAMRQLVKSEHDLSIISLPLQLDNLTIGVFSISAIGRNLYTERHVELISVLKDPFTIALSNDLRYRELVSLKEQVEDDNRFLREELNQITGDEIIGAKTGLLKVMQLTDQVAPMGCPVLLLGETGTGKELIANAVHFSSPRKSGPFIKVNCGAIPESLIDSELFGHEKGAFTGALSQKAGRFERAHGGTIFLDEIGELPPKAQVRLLRVLQQKEIERVGGVNMIPVDVRIISATNRNLEEMVDSGEFREDLWFRLNVFPIVIPPLRMRVRDISDLVSYMIRRKAAQMNINRIPEPAPDTIRKLSAYHWPGNVRELENVVERSLIRHKGGLLHISPFFSERGNGTTVADRDPFETIPTLDQGITNLIHRALDATNGKIYGPGGAAEILDMHPNTLRYKIDKLGIRKKIRI
ncbi:sigma 54-interacting transcriptional regulator [bacterium]|nr:sigma 54-interacting transcriptional regulator [bacterium]